MGSGCSGNNINGYFGTPIPDKGVKYTGPSIPALDICTGDFLNEIEAIIFAKLLEFMEGKGIQVPEINLNECPFIQEFITCCSEDKSLEKLFTILFKAICSLKTDLTSLEDRVDEVLNITFNLRCLTVSNPTIGNVINEIIREFCLLKTRVEVLEATVIDLQRQIDELTLSITETITDLHKSLNLNELIMTGVFNNTSYFDDLSLTYSHNNDGFVALLDMLTLLTRKVWPATSDGELLLTNVVSSGDYIFVSGYFYGNAFFDSDYGYSANKQFFVWKFKK